MKVCRLHIVALTFASTTFIDKVRIKDSDHITDEHSCYYKTTFYMDTRKGKVI